MKHVFLTVLATTMVLASEAIACVGCRTPGSDTIVNEPQTALAGIGFSWGVLVMLTCVLSVVGGMVAYICKTIARLDRSGAGQ